MPVLPKFHYYLLLQFLLCLTTLFLQENQVKLLYITAKVHANSKSLQKIKTL